MNMHTIPAWSASQPGRLPQCSKSRKMLLKLCLAISLFPIGLSTAVVSHAQNAPETSASSPTLLTDRATAGDRDQKYQAELDRWMLRAYEGDRDAQFKVGVLLTNDQFSRPDYEQAVYWYKQAARQGHVLAQYNLGHQYLTGVGVRQSDRDAMQWWLKAAQQDHALAQFNVGRAYYLGIGFDQDLGLSRKWFERAAANNEPKSIDILQQLGWTDNAGSLASANLPDKAIEVEQSTDEPAEDDQTTEQLTSVVTAIDDDETSQTEQPIITNEQANKRAKTADSQDKEIAPQDATVALENATLVSTDADEVANNSNNSSSNGAAKNLQTPTPLALYTDPEIRSVLIALVDDTDTIDVQSESGDWSIVRSRTGFPVWVHGDFLIVDDGFGTVTGKNVNARSVPIVTNGTVVGRLQKTEMVSVVENRDDWYRIIAPPRFKAWVKTSELARQRAIANANQAVQSNAEQQAEAQASSSAPQAATAVEVEERSNQADQVSETSTGGMQRPINDNDWLFSQPTDSYTLQLASFDDADKIEEFESRAKFINNRELHRFTALGKGIVWTYYLYGSYPNREQADAAKTQINQKLAWIRRFGLIQQNRCVAWKTQLPTPKELNRYCVE